MADREVRETQVVTGADGRVVETSEIRSGRRGGGFGTGAVFGIVILAVAVVAFAWSQGSFTNAGADADRATVEAQDGIGNAIENTGDVLETAGDNAKQAGENANN